MTNFEAKPQMAPAEPEFAADLDGTYMFEMAPVSLWLEDYSALRELFDSLRSDGVIDLRAWLREQPSRVAACWSRIRLIKVNRRTLDLYGAADLEELKAGLDRVFRDDMHAGHIDELGLLWDGNSRFGGPTVNYTLQGQRLDIVLDATILPGHEKTWSRVLLAIEDISDRSANQQALAKSEAYARGLFDDSPVSLWVEDFSSVKTLIDEVRAAGVVDFRTFTDVHPEFVQRCMAEIRVVDVNRQTLRMFAAPDKQVMLRSLHEVFRDEMQQHFREQLVDLWNGKTFQQRETVNYTLAGDRLDVYLQFSVIPGRENDWGLALISLTDITARKKAESYLEFLGKHDSLTKLRNRSYFTEEMARLDRRGPWPVTVVMLDLNGLKGVNDDLGHVGGDELLRRAGETLAKAVDKSSCAARIGGDEFALLLPSCDEAGADRMGERIDELVELNNKFYGGAVLSFSIGCATTRQGERLEPALHVADQRMYASKRAHYESTGVNRRRSA